MLSNCEVCSVLAIGPRQPRGYGLAPTPQTSGASTEWQRCLIRCFLRGRGEATSSFFRLLLAFPTSNTHPSHGSGLALRIDQLCLECLPIIATTSICYLRCWIHDAIGHHLFTPDFLLHLYSHHVRLIRGGGIHQRRTPSGRICNGGNLTATPSHTFCYRPSFCTHRRLHLTEY